MLQEKTKLFKALSDQNRLRILKMLQSKHLFIIEEKEGKWVNYKINPTSGDQRVSSILTSLDFWIEDDEIISIDKKKLKKVDRFNICGG